MKHIFFFYLGIIILFPLSVAADFLAPFEKLVDPTGVLKEAALSKAYSTSAQQFLMHGYLFLQSLFAKPLSYIKALHENPFWMLAYLQSLYYALLIVLIKFLKKNKIGHGKDKVGLPLLSLIFFIALVISLLQIGQHSLPILMQHTLNGTLLLMTFHVAMQTLLSIHNGTPFSFYLGRNDRLKTPSISASTQNFRFLGKGIVLVFIPLLIALNISLFTPERPDITQFITALYFLYIVMHIGFSCYASLTFNTPRALFPWASGLTLLCTTTFLFWLLPFYAITPLPIDWAWGLNIFLCLQFYALLPFLKSMSTQLLKTYRKRNGFLMFLEQFISLSKGLQILLTFLLALCFIKLMLLLNLHVSKISIFEIFIDKLLLKTLSVIIILWGAFLLQGHINTLIHDVLKSQKSRLDQKNQHQKFFALMSLITNFLPIVLWVFATYLILLQLDPQYFSYLAGLLGLLVIGIGFVGRSHIADILAGIVYTFQGLLGRGRYIKINGSLEGKIEEMRFQSISLREESGALNTISYAQIKNITTYDHNFAPLSIALLKTAPLQESLDLIRSTCNTFSKKNPSLSIEDIAFTRIQDIDGSHISLNGYIQTQKLAAWETWSKVTPLLKKTLLEKGFMDKAD